jgi:gliding motility-associated-like protein
LSSVNFTASGGNSIIWNGPNSFNSNSYSPIISPATPANSGNYSVNVTNLNGCTASTTINLLVNSLPVIVATNPINVCEGQSINLNASGGATYVWSGPNAYSSNIQNPVIPSSNLSNSGTYSVVVSSVASCTSAANVNVNVNAAPTGSAGSNAPLCENNRLTLFGSAANSYSWSGPNGFVSLLQNPEISNVTITGSGVYTLTISNAVGCSRSIQLPVTIFPLPNLSLQASKKEACVPECISFNAISNASGSNVVYNWNLDKSLTTSINGANASGCYNQLGNYKPTVQVIDANGCSRTTSVDISLNPNPEPNFNFEPNKPTLYNNVVDLNYLKNNDKIAAYEWYINNNPSSAWTPNTSQKFEETGDYYVTLVVISDKGCKGSVTKLIRVEDEFALFIPNAFTPNDDGKNDVFLPKGTAFKNYSLGIFNRWGELLFNSTEFTNGWDGTFKGEKCPDGVYTYKINVIIEGGKAKEFVGKVSLLK